MHPKFGSHPHLYPDVGILLDEFLPLWNRGNSINFDDNSISWSLMKSFWEVGRLNQQTIQLWNQIWNAKVSTQNCRLPVYIQQTSLFSLWTVVVDDYLQTVGRLRHLKNNFKKMREIRITNSRTITEQRAPWKLMLIRISIRIREFPTEFIPLQDMANFWSSAVSAALAEDCAVSSSLLLFVY